MCGVGWGVGALVLAALMQLRQHLRIVRGGSPVEQLGRAGVGELAVEAVVQLEPEVHREAPAVRVGGSEAQQYAHEWCARAAGAGASGPAPLVVALVHLRSDTCTRSELLLLWLLF